MSEFVIVLAEPDENYILPLVKKLFEKFQKNINLIVITDRAYLSDFLSRTQKIDLFVLANEWNEVPYTNYDIGTCLILCEDGNAENEIEKYNHINDIYQEICMKCIHVQEESKKIILKKSRVIAVYSPIGGVGKTLIAVALSRELEKEKKQVLYLSMDKTQAFQYFLQDKHKRESTLHLEAFYYLEKNMEEDIEEDIEDSKKEWEELQLQMEAYDWVVADLPCELMDCQSKLLSIADEVLFVLQQDPYSYYKCERFIEKMDIEKLKKCYFVCNKYRIQKENKVIFALAKKHILLDVYIEYSDVVEYAKNGKEQLEEFSKLQGVNRLIRSILLFSAASLRGK